MHHFSHFPTACHAEAAPQRIAIVRQGGQLAFLPEFSGEISWQQWHGLVQQAVGFLQKFAIRRETLVAYYGYEPLAGLLCYLAVLAAGGRILMLTPALTESQRQTILQENGVDLLLTDADFADFAKNYRKQTACELPSFNPEQPATFTLTSGSSGKPKAVVHTIHQHLENAQGVCEFTDFQAGSSWLLSLPLYHVSGQGIVWRWLLQGARLYLSERKTDFWHALSCVSHASLVPTQLQRYLQQTEVALPSKQHILLGGAAIAPELIACAKARGLTTYAGYGMTETASTVTAVKHETDNVGTPLAGREVRLVQGEIWVRGAGLACGYWQADKIVPLTNSEGWFATKDSGEWNEQGKLVVNGRLDNRFISGGENIQPEEVEQVLFASGLVVQAVVLPQADAEFGFRPLAVVQFHQPFSPQAVEKLQNFATQHLERFKQPIAYIPLPLQWQSGIKIARKQLQAEIEQRI